MLRYLLLFIICMNVNAQDTVKSSSSKESDKLTEEKIDLAIGIDEIKTLSYKFDTRVSIANEKILRLKLSPRRQEITFRGVKPGTTSVIVRDAKDPTTGTKYIVKITSDGQSKTVQELRELIGDVEGLEIGIRGGKVYVEGELIVPDDIGKVSIVLDGYKDVLRLIEISPQTQRVIARKIQDELARNNMRDVSVRVVNKAYWLEGVVNSSGKKEAALKIAEAYVPPQISSLAANASNGRFNEAPKPLIMNFVSVNEKKDPPPPKKQVKISAQFVELSKDYQRVFGFKWAPIMSNSGSLSFGKTAAGEISTQENNTLSGTISQLLPKLQTARSAGYARVLQSGMVITKSEQQASINKTKNIPFAIGSGEFQQAQSAELKFQMSVTPKTGQKEKIELDGLNISVSLPSGVNTGGQPITTSNSIQTNVVVNNKESAVIGGIVQNTSTTGYDKNDPNPYGESVTSNADASVLFNYLRSKSYVTEKSQFVVFITPEIIESASTGTAEIRKKFRKRSR